MMCITPKTIRQDLAINYNDELSDLDTSTMDI
jgi:hypothetical protein